MLRTLLIAYLSFTTAAAFAFESDVAPLIEASCIGCHDSGTETGLNLETLGHDLSDAEQFRTWEKIFDRVHNGEMPPAFEEQPDPAVLKKALASLEDSLRSESESQQKKRGRVPARRLTKLELGYTLRDLLLIDSDVTNGIPEEVESGSFDTVGAAQRISAVHMEGYLDTADRALDSAIQLRRNPYDKVATSFDWLEPWHDKEISNGGSMTRKMTEEEGEGFVLFNDVDYLTNFYFALKSPGTYRLSAKVAAYQTDEVINAKIISKNGGGSTLLKTVDLEAGADPVDIFVETYLNPQDKVYLTMDAARENTYMAIGSAGGSKNYKGPGLAVYSQTVEGPLSDSWPPASTTRLFDPLEIVPIGKNENGPYRIRQDKHAPTIAEMVRETVREFAPRVFRRPVEESELQPFIALAKPAMKENRPLVSILRLPLRSMLSSPQFLMFAGDAGELDDHALASRLSYFLWKSMPDEELFSLAELEELSSETTLAGQVDRLLGDERSQRFVKDFLGQWLRLYKVNATTPDDGLYPEYDELLAAAIPREPERFFTELINENLSVTNLIDSDFAFVNRRLANHYGLPEVKGQNLQKVALPEDSSRGGILTQAAILKTSANGTTTSPVMRGNFVLTNFLGTPPSPPPPDIGSIEPDTRGKTTIREILAAHRDKESCNQCHCEIDPPGFALESFDPIGRFREHYRVSGGERNFFGFVKKMPPKKGRPVDPSGVTADGKKFADINEFKQHLLDNKEQVARNFVSQLIVYATGGELQFADRDDVQAILDRTRENDYPVKDVIHEVVQSQLFRCK